MADHDIPSNRNGHVGAFEAFAPQRKSLDRIVEDAIAFKQGRQDPDVDRTVLLKSFLSVDLVRYHLNSARIRADFAAIGDIHSKDLDEPELYGRVARFGVIDRASGEPLALLRVYQMKGAAPYIGDVSFSQTRSVDALEMLDAIRELDVPLKRSRHVGSYFANRYDIWFENGEWATRPKTELLVQSFSSSCFSTSPPMTRKIDVFILHDPDQPLDGGGDSAAAEAAKERYYHEANTRFYETDKSITGAGFSSWMMDGEARVVKVVDSYLDAEIAELLARKQVVAAKP
jgi:hypothetical protein